LSAWRIGRTPTVTAVICGPAMIATSVYNATGGLPAMTVVPVVFTHTVRVAAILSYQILTSKILTHHHIISELFTENINTDATQ